MALVIFHKHGCPYCEAVTGAESAARHVADLEPVYEIESADPLRRQLDITSFPTILFSTPHVVFRFEGPRTPEALRKFVLEKMGQSFILEKLLKRKAARSKRISQ
jgi:thioredoxin-related protein